MQDLIELYYISNTPNDIGQDKTKSICSVLKFLYKTLTGFSRGQCASQGKALNGLRDEAVLGKFQDCLRVPPMHIYKFTLDQPYCHLHFATEGDASLFFHRSNRNPTLREQFSNLTVRPARNGGVDVTYDKSSIQTNINHFFVSNSFFEYLENEIEEDKKKYESDGERLNKKIAFFKKARDILRY